MGVASDELRYEFPEVRFAFDMEHIEFQALLLKNSLGQQSRGCSGLRQGHSAPGLSGASQGWVQIISPLS